MCLPQIFDPPKHPPADLGAVIPQGLLIAFIFQESHTVAGVADGRVFFSGGRKMAVD